MKNIVYENIILSMWGMAVIKNMILAKKYQITK